MQISRICKIKTSAAKKESKDVCTNSFLIWWLFVYGYHVSIYYHGNIDTLPIQSFNTEIGKEYK